MCLAAFSTGLALSQTQTDTASPSASDPKVSDKATAYYNFAMGHLYAELAGAFGNRSDYTTVSRRTRTPGLHPLVACENLASTATSEDAARSAAFFGRLLQRFDLSPDRLILAPAPVGWQSWGNYEYARSVAGRNLTTLLSRILGQAEHGSDSWWQLSLPDHSVSLTVLDSTQMSGPERLGELGSRQLAWLRDEFGSLGTDQRLQVVIMHHDPATRLLDAGAFSGCRARPGTHHARLGTISQRDRARQYLRQRPGRAGPRSRRSGLQDRGPAGGYPRTAGPPGPSEWLRERILNLPDLPPCV